MAKPQSGVDPQVEKLLSELDFSPESVIHTATRSARLFMDAAEYRIQCLRERNRTDRVADQTRADKALKLRGQAQALGEKLTEEGLKQMLLIEPSIIKAVEARDTAEEMDEWAKLLLEAFRMRDHDLEIIGRITGSEIAYSKALEAQAENQNTIRKNLKKKYPGGSI